MNFNFGEVLTRAWQITWKYKVLWVFGILASCGQGGGSSSGNNSNFNTSGGDLPPQLNEFTLWVAENTAAFIAITITLACVIAIVTLFLSTIGRVGLIRGTAQAEAGAETLVLGQLFSESVPYFWRMFGLSLILTIPILLVFVVFFVVFFGTIVSAGQNSDAAALSLLAMVPLFIGCMCLMIPILFVLGMIFRQAERAIVLEELGVMPALSRGWEVFKSNLGSIFIMAIILGILGFIIGLIIAIPIFVIVVPAMVAYTISGADSSTSVAFALICFCLYLPVLWVLQGIITSYTESAWTLTYMRLTGQSGSAQPRFNDNRPAPMAPDNAQTLISTEPLEKAAPAEPKDSDKTVIARKPDA